MCYLDNYRRMAFEKLYYFGQFNEKEQSTTNKSMLQHVKSIAKKYNNIK